MRKVLAFYLAASTAALVIIALLRCGKQKELTGAVLGDKMQRFNLQASNTSIIVPLVSKKTYVVVLKLSGQQGSAMSSLSVLQCTLGSFYNHFYIVEPYFDDYFVGTNDTKFSSIFDFDFFNVESRKVGYPEMATLDEYQQLSPKNIIYVIVKEKGRASVVWSAKRDGKKVRCYDGEVDKVHKITSMQPNIATAMYN